MNTWDRSKYPEVQRTLSNPSLACRMDTVAQRLCGCFFMHKESVQLMQVMMRNAYWCQWKIQFNAIAVPVNGNAPYYYGDT